LKNNFNFQKTKEQTSLTFMDTLNWDDILEDIDEQRAVLLIGHNFLPNAHEQLNKLLTDKLGEKLQHFYSRDGLFLFKDSDAKTTAQQVTARFYKSNPPEEELLKKIVEMPFRLMISANPDKFLVQHLLNNIVIKSSKVFRRNSI
jgi:hypothetical protein